jgi:exodeoxyribonuclease VII large subunit
MLRATPAPHVYSVAELVGAVDQALRERFGPLWVAGEISNLRAQPAGHVYFTLKDDRSKVDAVMFRSAAQLLAFRPANGMEIVVQGRVSIYAERGAFQLYVDAMEPRGLGALRLAFEQLKARLDAEGLFAAARKRPLPRFPRGIGIVTALHGAAVHDMLTVLRRRWPLARVIVRPVKVQGPGAARDIADGIDDLNRGESLDVLIVGRGGGSLEDLWAFNEEVVARAIAASRLPVVSAVGHEVDFTIADFVADARAPTPTAAAALVVPDQEEALAGLVRAAGGLRAGLVRRTKLSGERLAALERRLGDPRRRVADVRQRVDELGARSLAALRRRLDWERRELRDLSGRLVRGGPAARAGMVRERLRGAAEHLRLGLALRVRAAHAALERSRNRLEVLSPLACLERGYAIVRQGGPGGPVVRDAAALRAGETVSMVFAQGSARARVEETEEKK